MLQFIHVNRVEKNLLDLKIFNTKMKNEQTRNLYKVRTDSKDQESIQSSAHLSQDTKWESNQITINITNKSQEVSPFPSGDHKAAMNSREKMTNTRHK